MHKLDGAVRLQSQTAGLSLNSLRDCNRVGDSGCLICLTELGKYRYFDDGWKDDGCFHYRGQSQEVSQGLHAGNRTIAEVALNGRSLHLFYGPPGAFAYQGKFELDPVQPYYWTYPVATSPTP